jgi:hypothetical protein
MAYTVVWAIFFLLATGNMIGYLDEYQPERAASVGTIRARSARTIAVRLRR